MLTPPPHFCLHSLGEPYWEAIQRIGLMDVASVRIRQELVQEARRRIAMEFL